MFLVKMQPAINFSDELNSKQVGVSIKMNRAFVTKMDVE